MFSKEELESSPEYWVETAENTIWRMMTESGLTFEEIALKSRITPIRVYSWMENGDFDGSMEEFVKLCLACNRKPSIGIV